MNERDRMFDLADRAYRGDAWHGPSVCTVLEGVGASQAAHRPIPDAHTIWEIVRHIAVWKIEVAKRLEGEPAREVPPEEDWPPTGDGEADWHRALLELAGAHERFRQAITHLDEARMDVPLTGTEGSRWTAYTTAHGAIQHDLYHAGQIAVLKKARPGG
jgi:uncharacterized damage-inducible protein DinB